MAKELVMSITKNDCEWEYFRVGGAGGQHRDKTSAGVRCTHKASGATGLATNSRSQTENRSVAFRRMAESPKFKAWVKRMTSAYNSVADAVDKSLTIDNLVVEYRDGGRWVPADTGSHTQEA